MPTTNSAASDYTDLVKINTITNVLQSYPTGSVVGQKNLLSVAKAVTTSVSTSKAATVITTSVVSQKATATPAKTTVVTAKKN